MDAAGHLDDGRERERKQADTRAVGRDERDDVVAPALDPDRGQRIATGAGLGLDDHAVAQVIADDRLHPIGEIGEQDRVRRLAGRCRTVVRVHRLQHHPVGVDVQPPRAAADGHAHALRRTVLVDHAAAEGAFDFGACRFGQAFASRPQAHGRNGEPAGGLLIGEQRQHRRIRREECGLAGVQRRSELRQRLQDRERSHRNHRGRGREAPPGSDACIVAAGRGDERGAAATGGKAPPDRHRQRRRPELRRQQRIVGGDRVGILHEGAGYAGTPRARPDKVPPAVPIADVAAIGQESCDVGAGDPGVRDPVVEARLELAPADDRERAGIDGARRERPIAFTIERRIRAGKRDEIAESHSLRGQYRGDAALPRPPDVGGSRAPVPPRRGREGRVPGSWFGSIAHAPHLLLCRRFRAPFRIALSGRRHFPSGLFWRRLVINSLGEKVSAAIDHGQRRVRSRVRSRGTGCRYRRA